jgi:hypothetical protein
LPFGSSMDASTASTAPSAGAGRGDLERRADAARELPVTTGLRLLGGSALATSARRQ